MLNQNHSLRLETPTHPIALSKVGAKLACLRGAMPSTLASKIIAILFRINLFLRFFPFDGANCPDLWSELSEMIAELDNDVLLHQNWDSDETFSPHVSKLKKTMFTVRAFAFFPSLPTDIVSHRGACGRADACVDYVMTILLLKNNHHRLGSTTILDVRVFGRLVNEK